METSRELTLIHGTVRNQPSRPQQPYAMTLEVQDQEVSLARAALLRRGRRLEAFTIGWNVVECGVSIVSGLAAGSIALIAFGVDSFVETSSGVVLFWRLRPGRERAEERRMESRALMVVGISLMAGSAYVLYEAVSSLLTHEAPAASVAGIAVAASSVVAMPILARRKRKIAAALGSRALGAEAAQTGFCAYLSAILLAGLVLNAAFGVWWADPVAALAMAPIIAREGWEASRARSSGEEP